MFHDRIFKKLVKLNSINQILSARKVLIFLILTNEENRKYLPKNRVLFKKQNMMVFKLFIKYKVCNKFHRSQ